MKSLKIWQRIALIFLVMLATNLVCLALLNSSRSEAIEVIQREQSGFLYLEPIRRIRQWLPVFYRQAATNPNLVNRAANPPSLLNLERAMSRLDELDRRLEHQLTTTEDFVGLKNDWAAVKNSVSNPESLRQTYRAMTNRVRALIALTGDSSGLVLDNVLRSYYLIHVSVVDLPNADDLLNSLLDFGSSTIGKPQLTAEDNSRLLFIASALQTTLNDTNSHLKVAMEQDPDLALLDMPRAEHENRVLALLAYVGKNMINQRSVTIAPAEFASVVQAALDENFKLYDAVGPSLDRVMQGRADVLRAAKAGVVELILAMTLAGLVLTVWIARSVVVPIRQAIQALESREGAEISFVSTNRDEVSELIKAATAGRPSTVQATKVSLDEEMMRENQELRALAADLMLENRAQKAKARAAAQS